MNDNKFVNKKKMQKKKEKTDDPKEYVKIKENY